ncbi:hypothetical protein MKW92_045052, partial [Papaver armeniacum]
MLLQLGSIPTLVITSAEAAKQVLKIRDSDFCTRPPLATLKRLSYNYVDIVFAPYGEYWKDVRKILQSFCVIRAEEIAALVDSISRSSSASPIALIDVYQKILCIVLQSFSASDVFPKIGWILDRLTGFHGRLEKCFCSLDKFFQQVLDAHLDPNRPKPDYEDVID